MRGLFPLVLLLSVGCDAAEEDYQRCIAEANRGNVTAAQAACSAAVRKDPDSPAGKGARVRLDLLAEEEAAAKKKAEAEAAAKKKAKEEAKHGIQVGCEALVRSFLSDANAANERYLKKRVRTSGKINDTKWVMKGNLTLCPVGSDAEGQVSDILCKLDPKTQEDVRATLEVGESVKVVGVVEEFFAADIGIGTMSQLTLSNCEIVK